ncbi:hypothetical protein AGLY_007065 [Aphis glycines]|uniref:Uncharacterized protein n=1 Tax=Aphis glycines TaxID=307491 RepID=A0A6G0TPQ9_APHGL|nr:hypothetical protein AGLY_007065 [Aphis glycines]
MRPLHKTTQTEPDGPQSMYLDSLPSFVGTQTHKHPSGHVLFTFLRPHHNDTKFGSKYFMPSNAHTNEWFLYSGKMKIIIYTRSFVYWYMANSFGSKTLVKSLCRGEIIHQEFVPVYIRFLYHFLLLTHEFQRLVIISNFHSCSHCQTKEGNFIFSFNFSSLPFSDDQQYLSVGKSTYLVFIHFFLDPYRFVQVVHQQIRLIVASDGPHVILDGGNVFQVHANMGKWFPLIVERRQCENLPILTRIAICSSSRAAKRAIMQTGNLRSGLIAIIAANLSMHY